MTAQQIGKSNAACAIDQANSVDYENTYYDATSAYLVNTIDTAREYGVNAEAAVQAFRETMEAAKVTRKGYSIKTAKGYLATQGDTQWFQEEPKGWAAYGTQESASLIARSSKILKQADGICTIVEVDA